MGTIRSGWQRLRKTALTPLETVANTTRIAPMDGMRGYAVLLVFLVHHHSLFGSYLSSGSVLLSASRFAQDIGYSGVDLFFVLSGCLIYGILLKKPISWVEFTRRRIRRIYPTYLAMLGAYILLAQLTAVKSVPFSVDGLLYIAANVVLLPGIANMHPLITVAWSLSYEFFFYLTTPLLLALTGMRQWTHSRRAALLAGIFLLHCVGYRLNLLPHIRLNMFIAGMLLYECIDAGWFAKRLSRAGELGAIALYVATLAALATFEFSDQRFAFHPHFPNGRFVYWTLALAVAIPSLCTYAFGFDGLLRRVFTCTPARWLGSISYSYFLAHGLVLNGVRFALDHFWPIESMSGATFVAFLIGNLALTLAGGLALFVAVERPYSLRTPEVRQTRRAGYATAAIAE